MAANTPPPILQALLLCDTTIREAGTNKLSFIGIFNDIVSHQFPTVHPAFSVCVILSDGHGNIKCRLRMLCMENNKELFTLQQDFQFNDPRENSELIFQIKQLPIPTPGTYCIEFFAGQELLGSRKLRVNQAKQGNT